MPPGIWLASLVVSLALLPPGLSAQRRSPPFETVDLSLTLLADVSEGSLHRYWSPGLAFAAGAALPFYLGTMETGIQYAHPDAKGDDVPGFRSLFLFAGWGGGHELGGGIELAGGLRVGIMALRFDGDTIPAFRRNESELGVAGRLALRWRPRAPWFLESSVVYQSILTRVRMEQAFLSLGLGHRFGTPPWLRDFLD